MMNRLRFFTSFLATFLQPVPLYSSLSILLCGMLLPGISEVSHAQTVTFAGTNPSVSFGNVNLCAQGATTPAPCSKTLTLTYKVTASGTLGATKVVTGGAAKLDFTLAEGSNCTGEVTSGANCVVNVHFAPKFAGTRPGAVQITDENGRVLATTFISGFGAGPQLGFDPGTLVYVPFELTPVALGFPPAPDTADFFNPEDIAVDGAGDIFIAINSSIGSDFYNVVAELPADGSPQKTVLTLPENSYPGYLAVDGAGNLYVTATNTSFSTQGIVIEVPAGSDAPVVLPFAPTEYAPFVAVDAGGNVYTAANGPVKRLAPGSDTPVAVPGLVPSYTIEVDGSGDIFTTDSGSVHLLELPAGGDAEKTLYSSGVHDLALDDLGNAYINGNPFTEIPAGGGPLISIHSAFAASPYAFSPAGDLYGMNCCYAIDEAQRSVPPTLNFGVIPVGSSVSLPQIVTNTGTGTLAATATIDDAAYRIKSMTPANCLASIGPSEKCQLEIEFSPATIGTQEGQLRLQTNAVNTPAAAIILQAGAALPPPTLSLSPGVYASAQTISIADAVAEAAIYYTTDGSTPTTSSARYTAPVTVSSTGRLTAIAVVAGSASAIATAAYAIAPATPAQSINLGAGFTASSIQLNGNATLDGSRLQLTSAQADGQTLENQAGSAFYTTPVNIQAFTTNFIFQLTDPDADGITFTIQNTGPKALGAYGKSLGYGSIARSVAVKFDLHNNAGEGPDSTGLYVNGALPAVPSIDLTGTGINLHDGESYLAQVTYNGTNLTLTLTDTISLATWSHTFAIDIPAAVGGNTAYMGFTGGAGAEAAQQEILSWTYVSGTPGRAASTLANPPALPPVPTYPNGFAGPGMIFNGSASHPGTAVQLTDYAKSEAGSAFYAKAVNVQAFTTDFSFQAAEYGMTFTLQNEGLNALGNAGDSIGYAPIGKSVAIKFSLYSEQPPSGFSIGLFTEGALPASSDIDLTYAGVNFYVPVSAHITYDGAILTLTVTDADGGLDMQIWSQSFPIDIPAAVGGNTAYVGFTGSTGTYTGVQQVMNWTFTNP